jgi:hypothetical protein
MKRKESHLYSRADPIATLKAGLRTVRHHTLGWLKQDLLASGELVETKKRTQRRNFRRQWDSEKAKELDFRRNFKTKVTIIGLLTVPRIAIYAETLLTRSTE